MRYMLRKESRDENTVLTAYAWSEPFCFSKTAPEKKIQKEFPLTPEGKEEAVSWLNEIYQLEFA